MKLLISAYNISQSYIIIGSIFMGIVLPDDFEHVAEIMSGLKCN